MFRLFLSLLCISLAVAGSTGYICPTYVRAVHTYNPAQGTMPIVDVYLNGQLQWPNVPFRGVGAYVGVASGSVTLGVRAAGTTGAFIVEKTFTAAPGRAYTVGFTGPLAGPTGQIVSNTPPIVIEDAVQVPNPGRWRGLWYRWSETPVDVDFRVIAGNPAPMNIAGNNVSVAMDVARLSKLIAKTVIPIPETVPGVFSFYPTVVGSNDPLFNAQRNEYVRIANLTTVAGRLYDFFATGDSLLAAHPNNLALVYTENTATFDTTSGCTLIAGASGTPSLIPNSVATVQVSALVVVGAILSVFVMSL